MIEKNIGQPTGSSTEHQALVVKVTHAVHPLIDRGQLLFFLLACQQIDNGQPLLVAMLGQNGQKLTGWMPGQKRVLIIRFLEWIAKGILHDLLSLDRPDVLDVDLHSALAIEHIGQTATIGAGMQLKDRILTFVLQWQRLLYGFFDHRFNASRQRRSNRKNNGLGSAELFGFAGHPCHWRGDIQRLQQC